ncbi:phosphodiester glycosidase family protein [Ornithinibacillus californiensis]|uniref:phosphodiester glycosidase family protein n=1 Tax=Ornithinibacillus californiensis TaxID=161536 RepID=UPI00069EB42C|nr:phosphodiester glycosidase family protein [Ornithinibacillus californiensis]
MKFYNKSRVGFIGLVVVLLIASSCFSYVAEAAEVKVIQTVSVDEFTVAKGVEYKDIRIKKETINESPVGEEEKQNDILTEHNAIRVLEINTNNPDLSVHFGRPDNITTLQATTTQALNYHMEGNYVVGAINGSFAHLDTKPRFPMSLISENNRLIFGGEIGGYINNPIAFGVDNSGKGIIDYYNMKLNYSIGVGDTYAITSVNKPRSEGETILYTTDFYSDYTETNEYGQEVVVSLSSAPDFEFGDTYTGEIIDFRDYGDNRKIAIPENGFVLSFHGKKFKTINLGDSVTISMDIDSKWKNTEFMVAGGPMLVKDGKVNLTMDTSNRRAREIAPRSAIAIDKTGEKYYFITVDGRQTGYSKGMNLSQFANYLAELGVDRALNIDGGGSTTMAVRLPGGTQVEVANSPSDGRQRGVPNIFYAVTKENGLYYKDMSPGKTHYDGVRWLSERGIKGYADGTFGVGNQLTRPHAAIMFVRALGLSVPDKKVVEDYFEDVTADDLYAEYMAAVAQAGVFKGSNGQFLPNQNLTREQMASTLVNAFGLETNGSQKDIKLDNVGESHKANVQILADLGITNQLENFRPKEIVTRGQFATFLYLSVEYKNGLK